MDVRHANIAVTTSTSIPGSYSKTISAPGPLLLHVYIPGGHTFSAAADLSITDANTGMTLLSVTNFGGGSAKTYTPRRLINNAATGTASTSVFDYQAITGRITVAITGATTAAQTGTINVVCG